MPYLCSCAFCSGLNLEALVASSPDTVLQTPLVQAVSPAAPANTVITTVISGDNRIDSLLLDSSIRLNSSSPPGTPITVTYSFPSFLPTAYRGENAFGWKPFSIQQQAATREVLNLLQKQINITFVEVSSTSAAGGTIRLSNNTQAGSAGYAFLANSSGSSLDSDVFISNRYSTNVTSGSFAWTTLVHEIGHALGLKHPGNYDATQTIGTALGNILGVTEDTFFNTIMSYRDSAQGINTVSFMPYDLLALRYLYGTRAFENGNSNYTFTDLTGQSIKNIVDDGGIDTLDFSALTLGIDVNLMPGSYSSVGRIPSGVSALANLTTSLDTVIENVVGTNSGDIIYGNAANNTFTGGGGDDVLKGGEGIDTTVFSGPMARYIVSKTPAGQSIRDKTGVEGADDLTAIERVLFSDGKLALDLDGHAGQAVKLIGAVFGAAAVANISFVGIGLKLLDDGTSYERLATLVINATGKTSAADVVALLWSNLVGSAPTNSESAPYVALLDGGLTAGALAILAADSGINTTNIKLVGLAQTGVAYS